MSNHSICLFFFIKIFHNNFNAKNTYIKLLPRNARSQEGQRHQNPTSVKLVRASNDEKLDHPGLHFAHASVGYVKKLMEMLGPDNCICMSNDDKAVVPLGKTAAKLQAPILMKANYRVRMPDHDYIVGTRHHLIPSVYLLRTHKDMKT